MNIDPDSILLIDKPAGMSSFGVVARIRRVLSAQIGKKAKVGHTGTLDPFATGLMILVTGTVCRDAGRYSKLDKVYEATFTLGRTSTTGDPEGEIIEVPGVIPTLEDINKVLRQHTGQIEQTPPTFSAIKVNGQRAYKLARKGEKIEIPTRLVTVKSLECIEYVYPELKVRADVSSGTYIRSLAEAIGASLGTGAYCSQLRRISIDKFSIDQAGKLSDFGIDS